MVSHKYKTIIVHIPKTGGTSIENSLDMDYGGGRHLLAINGRNTYSGFWDEYFKFTFVRNPWDRMVSLYHYYKLNKEPQNKDVKVPPTFREFVIDFNNGGQEWYGAFSISQKSYISDENGNILVDYIGRFEDYNKDVNFIFNKLNFNGNISHDRKSNRGDYKLYYDDETIEIVRNLFKEDIDYFKYEY